MDSRTESNEITIIGTNKYEIFSLSGSVVCTMESVLEKNNNTEY